ncbi:hypothetical protein AVEN_17960-1 [Araneus ventricosus]|uniref:Uncharacterized protein n=1 Tax=Araneus ventricosus TaxID=182803 RepID=A0A4Y2KSN1_ARAVE|nr:hypothetical protein AVEN_17960-1 [Araneus ventricosus]
MLINAIVPESVEAAVAESQLRERGVTSLRPDLSKRSVVYVNLVYLESVGGQTPPAEHTTERSILSNETSDKIKDRPDNQQCYNGSSSTDVAFFIKSLKSALEKSGVADGNGNQPKHPNDDIDKETLLFISKWLRNELFSRASQPWRGGQYEYVVERSLDKSLLIAVDFDCNYPYLAFYIGPCAIELSLRCNYPKETERLDSEVLNLQY